MMRKTIKVIHSWGDEVAFNPFRFAILYDFRRLNRIAINLGGNFMWICTCRQYDFITNVFIPFEKDICFYCIWNVFVSAFKIFLVVHSNVGVAYASLSLYFNEINFNMSCQPPLLIHQISGEHKTHIIPITCHIVFGIQYSKHKHNVIMHYMQI